MLHPTSRVNPIASCKVLPQIMEGIEGSALAAAVAALLVTQQSAERAGIAGPTQGWPSWGTAVANAGRGQLEDSQSATDTSGLHSGLCRVHHCDGDEVLQVYS